MLPLAAALFAQGLITAGVFAFIMHAIPATAMGMEAAKSKEPLTLRNMLPIPDPNAPQFNPDPIYEPISQTQSA